MNYLLLFGLFCHLIWTTHLDKNSNDLQEEKSANFENIPEGPFRDIFGRLDQEDQVHLAKISRALYKYDPSEVVLNLPLQKSKKPTQFLCDYLNEKKDLVINLEDEFEGELFGHHSLEMKYLECLSGIENLRFGEFTEDYKILVNPNFKVQQLFPKLRYLELKLNPDIPLNEVIPDYLKALKLYHQNFNYEKGSEVKEKISHMKTTLKEKIIKMKKLENLSIYIADLTREVPSPLSPMISELKHLPKFKHLSIEYEGFTSAIRDILPQIAHAKYYLKLEVKPYDSLKIDEFFSALPETTETLNLKLNYMEFNELNHWLHLLDSLPMNMDLVSLRGHFKSVEDFDLFERKLLTLKNRIKLFTIKLIILSNEHSFTREYVFDGSKMIRKE